ncbi:hypothetical protein KAR02_15275 [Candidatus Bipolaricaulota bacterium]|nr:hypothetical protein [Candidatus Bipolaricaulota bacterium]
MQIAHASLPNTWLKIQFHFVGTLAAILSPHNKHTLEPLHSTIVNTLEPERKRTTLGRFRPETKMRGRWVGYVAMACVVGSFVLYDLWGWIPGAILAASAVALGKLGLDSKGRNLSLIALILGGVLIGVLLTVLIVGKENIGITPK